MQEARPPASQPSDHSEHTNIVRVMRILDVWSTKPSKAPLTSFILQPSKQANHALPRQAYGADLQANYTSFLLSPPLSSSSSPNARAMTSRPPMMSTAKHTHNTSRAQSLSDPFASSSPRPSTTPPRPSSTSRPSPSSPSSTTTTPFVDALPHLQARLHL
ncbi:hypothetical protein BDN70DRAFT_997434 [Pholiota conissans]|uniref:Uncharacterized protein n=1 Tax=Pholiota conissans TaxID=109636 RepID=A0A9P5YQ66_9AGAR|nr:hypothetical protein BDN70DRAFT_997434 [Pholiota conissans]